MLDLVNRFGNLWVVNLHPWAARPTVLFAAAYLLGGALHEISHAIAASALQVPAVMFHYRVDIRPEDAAPWEHAVIAAAGPVASGAFALMCVVAYRRASARPGQLALFYLWAIAATVLFANMMSPVGDFARMEDELDMPWSASAAMAVVGFVGLLAVMAAAGREVRTSMAADMSLASGIVVFIAAPAIFGIALAALASQPMPESFTLARLSESLVWIVAAIAAWRTHAPSRQPLLRREWHVLDAIVVLTALAATRGLASGILVLP
jgi:hypothetical protein